MIGDDRPQCVNELGSGRIVERSTGRRLVQSDHGVEIEEPDDGLAWSEVGDDVANLDGVPIAGTAALTGANPRA
jgi:hypothetical protein